ncbi:DgyrCDS14366 [Dimorphilus gyrociliatus]|uniref:DgyrCDS14366 n=1 Tax=Dimorphilus gyrociliatus TaxID=2664684 RepID=A0A7I8WDB7_9ANNE|nr:DgyrCDS14366 [Dimorphilus gyrociliatus]
MAKFCFECRKKINKLKQGTCSHCSHKLHWTCLSDGLCSICSSIQIRSLKIVLRRCDNSCTIKDATKESTIEGNIKEPIKNAVEKDKTLANITVTSMDVDHEQVVSHFSADAIEANELPLKDMNTDEINCAIHSFLKKEGALKQVPLLFAFMTSKKKKAYNILFRVRTLNELLEYKTPKKIVLDYERAVWKAALDNWESVTLTGCLFHWKQAVYRKIQELGYSSDFKKKRGQWFEMRQLMALPFLPFHIIPIEFGRIKDYLQSVKKLGDLIKYFERNWMMDRIWSPKQWSIYKNAIRTNNDVEGFHNRLNGNLRANSSFYLVVDELKREADLIPAYQRMLSERKILRYQRRQYKNMQNEIFKIWEKFEAHQMTSSQVLEKCCQLYSEMK